MTTPMHTALPAPPATVARLAPEAASAFAAAQRLVPDVTDPVLADLARLRIAQLLGDTDGSAPGALVAPETTAALAAALAQWPSSDLFSAAQRACLALTEQYVIDVSAVSDGLTDAVREHLGPEGLHGFVQALYVIDESLRLDLAARAIFGDDTDDRTTDFVDHADMGVAVGAFYAAATRFDVLDPVVMEVVRMRCGRVHNCRICKASRSRSAREAGVDEDMLDQIDFYERSTLPERCKVALRVTDAFVTRPGDIGEQLRRDLFASFTREEVVALTLDVMKFSMQKQRVTLGTDVIPGIDLDDGVVWFDFDTDGQVGFR